MPVLLLRGEGVTAMSSGIADGIVEMFRKKPMGKVLRLKKRMMKSK